MDQPSGTWYPEESELEREYHQFLSALFHDSCSCPVYRKSLCLKEEHFSPSHFSAKRQQHKSFKSLQVTFVNSSINLSDFCCLYRIVFLYKQIPPSVSAWYHASLFRKCWNLTLADNTITLIIVPLYTVWFWIRCRQCLHHWPSFPTTSSPVSPHKLVNSIQTKKPPQKKTK